MRRSILLALLPAALLTGCETVATERMSPGTVALPRARVPPDIHLTALLIGTVILDDGCVFVGQPAGPRRYVIWPHGTRLETAGGRLVLLNGRTRVSEGDDVALGGGSFHADEPRAFAFADSIPPATCLAAADAEVFSASSFQLRAEFDRRHSRAAD
jgi:hypothetical protein